MVCERSGAFNTLQKPIKFINVEFDGVSTILMSYLSVGEPKIGMRVVPIYRTLDPTYTITDLSWVPESTPESALPKGFTSINPVLRRAFPTRRPERAGREASGRARARESASDGRGVVVATVNG